MNMGYCRVSTDEQKRSGLSLEFQEQKIREYAQFKDIKDIQIRKDEGKSAKTLDRPEIQKILELANKGLLDTLIVYKLDRLTRSVGDLAKLVEIFDKKNVKFISISENFDTSTAQGKLMFNFIGAIAQWEREVISERTENALSIKRDKDEKLGGITPYGYEIKLSDKISRKGKKIKVLVPIKKEQDIIKRILKLHGEKNSANRIAQILNKEGVKTKNNAKWYHSTINYILRRESK